MYNYIIIVFGTVSVSRMNKPIQDQTLLNWVCGTSPTDTWLTDKHTHTGDTHTHTHTQVTHTGAYNDGLVYVGVLTQNCWYSDTWRHGTPWYIVV